MAEVPCRARSAADPAARREDATSDERGTLGERREASRAILVLLLILAATAWAYRGNLRLGFTDADALADVAAARVESFGDLARQLWQPLTGGVARTNANFWRPVTMLHYALLRALFGWEPLGYQAWGLGLHLLAVVLAFALLRSARRPAGEALLGAGILALHPLGVETVPAVARHIDLLFNVFGLLTLLAITRGRFFLAFVAGLLAVGTKEVAVVLLPVAVLWALAWHGGRRAAGLLAAGWSIAVVLFLLGRARVLHGWGGYRPTGTTFFLADLGPLRATLRAGPLELLFPGWTPTIERYVPIEHGLALALLLLCAAATGALVAWRRGLRAPALGLALVLAPLLLYAATALYSRRLIYMCVIGLSIGSAALLAQRWLRWALALWLLTLVPACPLFHPDDDWRRIDAVATALTEDLASELAALPVGARLWVVDYPARLDHDPRRAMLWRERQSLNFPPASYSIQAWFDARLGRPDLDVRFLGFTLPVGALEEPRVSVEGDVLRVTRPPVERGSGRQERAEWEIESEGPLLSLRPTHAVHDEWLLVAGAPRSILVRVPASP